MIEARFLARSVLTQVCLLGALLGAVLPPQADAAATPIPIDRIVAIVNKGVITERQLNERVDSVMANLKHQNVAAPPAEVLRAQVLDRMVIEDVQLQFASSTGIRIDDTQLNAAVARIAEQNKLSVDELKAALEKDGMTYAGFRADIRREMTLQRLRDREVDSKVQVSDAEVDNYLSLNAANQDAEYMLSNIVVGIPEQASPEVVRDKEKRANEALAQLKSGKPFAEVAATYSTASNALSGGQLGWRKANRLPELYVEAASKLDKGQLSGLLKTANGFHIIQLQDKRAGNQALMIEQTHARHILIRTNEAVSESDAKARLMQVKERLDNGGKFEELARLYSEDSTGNNGGDLGWLSPGDTVPEFEQAMNALKPGQTSEPVRTQFGWHLIQVTERRQQDVSNDKARFEARQALRERKSDEQYDDWVRQLRDQAYVELRLDDQ